MIQLFGDYLVDKNKINAKQLLDSLLDQIDVTPSQARASSRLNLLTENEMLKVLRKQQMDGSDFISAATELKVWSPEKTDKLNQELRKSRKPLGEYLVEKGLLSLSELTLLLDEFLATPRDVVEAPVAVVSATSSSSLDRSHLSDFITDELKQSTQHVLHHFSVMDLSEDFIFESMADNIHETAKQLQSLYGLLGCSLLGKINSLVSEKMITLKQKSFTDIQPGLALVSEVLKKWWEQNLRFVFEGQDEAALSVDLNAIIKEIESF